MRRSGGDLAEDLLRVQFGQPGELPCGHGRIGQLGGPHAQHVDLAPDLQRLPLRVEHGRPVRELSHHGQPLPRAEARVHHARRPLHLPGVVAAAQAELAAVGPHASFRGQIDRGGERCLRRIAVLRDRVHGQEQLGGVELREGAFQRRGDGGRRGRGQRARGRVMLLLPVQQEGLGGRLGGGLGAEARGQADDQHPDHDNEHADEPGPPRQPDPRPGPAAGVRMRIAPGGPRPAWRVRRGRARAEAGRGGRGRAGPGGRGQASRRGPGRPAGPGKPGGPGGPAEPASRGPGTAGPCGRARPPRSLVLQDTIRLPVTFAVSALGLSPWLRHVWPGPGAYRRSVCPGPGPVPP